MRLFPGLAYRCTCLSALNAIDEIGRSFGSAIAGQRWYRMMCVAYGKRRLSVPICIHPLDMRSCHVSQPDQVLAPVPRLTNEPFPVTFDWKIACLFCSAQSVRIRASVVVLENSRTCEFNSAIYVMSNLIVHAHLIEQSNFQRPSSTSTFFGRSL
jgi:hypothetical protein